jgi:hypothetical protein
VTTNGVPSVCTGSCGYSFHNYTQVTSLSSSGPTLSLALNDPTLLNFTATSISVSVGGLPCAVTGGSTLSSLTCLMQTNIDGTPILVAGSLAPLVSVQPLGIAGLASGVSPLSIPLVASSLSLTSGGNNGGYLVILQGKGFPLGKGQLSIAVCGNPATIKTVTNIQAEFYVPACGSLGAQSVIVTFGTLSDSSLNFTYVDASATAPTIISLSPSSQNPALKGALIINGNGFGTNISAATVFLSNSTGKIYQLKIISLNDTQIKVGLPGGEAGVYKVEVNLPAKGDSIAVTANSNQFVYEFKITSVSPTTGSIFGGTLLTIAGVNFSPSASDTLVYVGSTLNWFCSV